MFIWRQIQCSDMPALAGELADPVVSRWLAMPISPCNQRNFASFVRRVEAECAAGRLLERLALNQGHELVGAASYAISTSEIAFWVARKHWGRGIGTRLLDEFIHNYIQPLQVDRVMAAVHPDNIGSQRVVEKCGFEKLGVFGYCYFDPKIENRAIIYRLLVRKRVSPAPNLSQ